jgi:hypothetical protein
VCQDRGFDRHSLRIEPERLVKRRCLTDRRVDEVGMSSVHISGNHDVSLYRSLRGGREVCRDGRMGRLAPYDDHLRYPNDGADALMA